MAIIFPEKIPDYIKNDLLRSTEVKVYNKLKEQLPDDYYVFYSSPWLGLNSDGSEIDGECDFTIVHESFGILTVEVKGGGIEIDNENQWWSTDRFGIKHKIKNPVNQARSSKYQFINKFKDHPDLANKFIRFNIGVILPNAKKPINEIRPDMPTEIFAVNSDMNCLDSWVRRRLTGTDDKIKGVDVKKFDKLGKLGVNAIKNMLAGQISFDLPKASLVRNDLEKIALKTDDQIHIIRELEDNKRMAISGAAGTGKTILAIEKVNQLSKLGKRVLFLCYNEPLGKWFELLFDNNHSVVATNYHSLCYRYAKNAGIKIQDKDFSELEEGFVDNFINSDTKEFDALVIDEGQDFETKWLQDLEIVIKDRNDGILYIFYDDNQKLRGDVSEYIFSLPYSKYNLRRNLRNTKRIFDSSNHFYQGKSVNCIGPNGEEVEFIEVKNLEKIGDTVRRKLGSLINDEEFSSSDIAVLLSSKNYLTEITNSDNIHKIGRFEIADSSDFETEKIRVDTIRRFKGLESPVILLVVDDQSIKNIELMYTAISRCQTYLVIIGEKKTISNLKINLYDE